jgi:hypothetical protein
VTHRTAIPSANRREWEVWAHMVAPRSRRVRLERVPWDPCPPEEAPRRWRFDVVPGVLDLGTTRDGLPIVASHALIEIIVRDPDGRERVVQPADKDLPLLLGGRTLREYEERALDVGDGELEVLHHPHKSALLKFWVWRPFPF